MKVIKKAYTIAAGLAIVTVQELCAPVKITWLELVTIITGVAAIASI